MTGKKRPTSAICGYDEDSIQIRGQDLVKDIIGQMGFVEYALYQSTGSKPSRTQIALVEAVMVTIMEHGLIPSAVASRLTLTGAPESFQGAIAAGLLGVGDRYAGTSSECGALLEEIVAAKNGEDVALTIVQRYRQMKRALPGFGHPVHKGIDPRVNKLLDFARLHNIRGDHIKAMYTLEAALNSVVSKPLVTNISAAIPAVLGEAGVPSGLMRGIILIARCAGLVGHVFEEQKNPVGDDMWHAASGAVSYEQKT